MEMFFSKKNITLTYPIKRVDIRHGSKELYTLVLQRIVVGRITHVS
jgi:hypothetical protein